MIVAERKLFVQLDGSRTAIPITIEVPVDERNAWRCDVAIGWPEGIARYKGMGVDAVQALHHALQMIAIHLYASPYHQAGQLVFEEPGQGYGFPLPGGGRDMAIGRDREL
jgi:hypothetical protein